MDEASERLTALEASDAGEPGAIRGQQEQRDDGSLTRGAVDRSNAQPSEPGSQETERPDANESHDTPAAGKPDATRSKESPNDGKAEDGKPKGDQPQADRYKRGRERLDKTWESVNKRKGELDTQEQQIKAREQTLAQREADIAQRASQPAAPQYKPEDIERASAAKAQRAQDLGSQADGLDARADKAEEAGDYAQAAKLRDQSKGLRKTAAKEEGNAEDLKAYAEELRKNPPRSMAQEEARINDQRKEWTLKAATDYPDLAKPKSELQLKVVEMMNRLWREDRAMAANPRMIYHVSRMAKAELSAARVPGLEKELGQLKAKVKDLEELTTPGGATAPQNLGPSSDRTEAEERQELEDTAHQMGSLR